MNLSDGYIANQICFWETSTKKIQYKNVEQPEQFYCRNFTLYTSVLTQPNFIPRRSNYQSKLENWNFLNKHVLSKLNMTLDNQIIDRLAKINKVTIAQFYTLLLQKIQIYKEGLTKENIKKIQQQQLLNSTKLSQVGLTTSHNAYKQPEQNQDCQTCKLYKRKIQLLEQEIEILKQQIEIK